MSRGTLRNVFPDWLAAFFELHLMQGAFELFSGHETWDQGRDLAVAHL